MAYSNEDRLGIPDFMQKTNTYHQRPASSQYRRQTNARNMTEDDYEVYKEMRRRSLDQKTIYAKQSRKKVDKSLKGQLQRHWKGIVLAMGLGAAALVGLQSLGDNLHEFDMINQNPVVAATSQAVNNHKSRTDDLQNWQLNTWGVGQDVDAILENGGDPLIVLGTLGSSLNETYTQDELSSIVEHSFGENPDTLVRSLNPERYEDGIQDPDFKTDVRNYIVQQTEADIARSHIDANSQLEAMLNSGQGIQNTGEKGMGGK